MLISSSSAFKKGGSTIIDLRKIQRHKPKMKTKLMRPKKTAWTVPMKTLSLPNSTSASSTRSAVARVKATKRRKMKILQMEDLAITAGGSRLGVVQISIRRRRDPEMTIGATTKRSIKTVTKWTKMVAWWVQVPMMCRKRMTRLPMKTTNIAGKRNRKYSISYSVRRVSIYSRISEWLRRYLRTFSCAGRRLLWKMIKILWKLCTNLLHLSEVKTIIRSSGQVLSRMRGFLEKYRVLPKTT